MKNCSPFVERLKTSWWRIHEYSVYDLAPAQKELKDSLDYPQIMYQVGFRIEELQVQSEFEFALHKYFQLSIQILQMCQNLRKYNNQLKCKHLEQKKNIQLAEMAQKTIATSIEEEPFKILARIILGEQVFQSAKILTSEEEVALLKKDRADILSIFGSCRWKVYLYNLESMLEIQQQVSQLKNEHASQIMKFIADRIKFLKRKYENSKMVVQLLAFTTINLKTMKDEVENYQQICKAQ